MSESKTSNSGESDHHFAPASLPKNTDYRHARWPRSLERRTAPAPPHPAPEPAQKTAQQKHKDPRHVVVVGVCSSGKSTLVRALRERGYRARACAQEHSGVPYLWQRLNPDVLIYLDASLPTIRQRRRAKWREEMLAAEHHRLEHAREHCNLYIPTDGLSPEDVASRVVTYLNNHTASSE